MLNKESMNENFNESIYESLKLSTEIAGSEQYSSHWNIFDKEFYEKLNNPAELYNFRNSGLSKWLDDSNIETDKEKIKNYYHSLIGNVGNSFYDAVAESCIGEPFTVSINGRKVDYNDLFLVNFSSQIKGFVPRKACPVIVEIGAGYGGLAVKLKKLFPDATVVLFDLPEVNAIQHHYIKRNFNDSEILHFSEFKSDTEQLNKETLQKYDFVILPGWCIENLEEQVVDVFVNTRSMMEMDFSIIEYYFSNIQRTISHDGFFYCVNRYVKTTVGYPIRIKDYPYDCNWYVVKSEPSWMQPAIHVLGCVRTKYPVVSSVREVLSGLKPYEINNLALSLIQLIKIISVMLRDWLRENSVVNYFVKLTGYQKYRERKKSN